MLDADIDNTPASDNLGPPPSGGGSSNSGLGKWNSTVLAAFEALNPGVSLEGSFIDPELPYRNLGRIDKIHRRQVEELTIANRLFRIKQGRYPSTDKELRGFLADNAGSIRAFWQNEINTTGRGVPRIFSDNYTLAEVRDWLADRNLFGLSDTVQSRPLEVGEKQEEKKQSEKTTEAKKETKTVESKEKPSVYTGVKPSAPTGPAQPGQVQAASEAKEQENSLDFDEIEDSGVALPAGLAGANVGVREKLASAARPGKRVQVPQGELSKRAKQRQRGKTKGAQRVQGTPGTVEEEVSGGASTGSTQVQGRAQASAQIEEESENTFSEANVVNQLPRAKIEAQAKVEAIADDSITPGFAEGEGSVSGGAQVAADGSLVPGIVEAKGKGKASARGELANTEGTAGQSQPAAVQKAGGVGGVNVQAEGEQASSVNIGTKEKTEGQSVGAQAPAATQAQNAIRGQAEINESAELEAEEEAASPLPEAVQQSLQTPVDTTNNVDGIAAGPGAGVSKPKIDEALPGVDSTDKSDFLPPGKLEEPKEKLPGEEISSGEEQGAPETQAPQARTKADEDYIAPQFAPREYQTPRQQAQTQKEKGQLKADGEKEDEDEDEDEFNNRPIGDLEALNNFAKLPFDDQLKYINDWVGQNNPNVNNGKAFLLSPWKMRLLEAASHKYPELKELLRKIKKAAYIYKTAQGLYQSRKIVAEQSKNLVKDLLYWGSRIGAEYVIKVWIFPYITISAFFDGGIEALLAFIGLHLYWFASLIFKYKGIFQGLTRWQKWTLAGIDMVIGFIILITVFIGIYGFCQLPLVGTASKAASYVTSDITYTFCNDLNAGITNISQSPAGQNLPPVPAAQHGP